jgi:superfamily II DNA/RNA helicase
MKFETLNVREDIVKALKEQGIIEPTSIQEKTIPLVYENKDIIGISRTGSGKTASFGIPIIDRVTPKQGVQSLILAPTRELANQISMEMRKWAKYVNIKIATVFGGVGFEPQVDAIARSEIVVGTPGRILDHIQRNSLKLNTLKTFVLDEADKMVEMGFIEDIERVMNCSNPEKQIILFGATISNEIDYLKDKYMENPILAETELQVKKDLLKQYFYNCQTHEKFSLLVHLLKKEDTDRVMVFCSKISTVDLVAKNLKNHGIKCETIHGRLTQNKRLATIKRFNEGTGILVASAVAARGLDIKDVTHIFNYDLPNDPQEYIHRIGRTARAGESGKAITLLARPDFDSFDAILRRYPVDVEELPAEKFEKLRFEIQRRSNGPYRSSGFNNGRSFNSSRKSYNKNSERSSGPRRSYGNSNHRFDRGTRRY